MLCGLSLPAFPELRLHILLPNPERPLRLRLANQWRMASFDKLAVQPAPTVFSSTAPRLAWRSSNTSSAGSSHGVDTRSVGMLSPAEYERQWRANKKDEEMIA